MCFLGCKKQTYEEMGANKKSMLKKCGDILINIKPNKKTKVYVFNCAFCDTNCYQLKKFSLHLDEKHSDQLSEESLTTPATCLTDDGAKYYELGQEDMKDEVCEIEVKVEELMEVVAPSVDKKNENKGLIISKRQAAIEDPLETKVMATKRPKTTEICVKSEHIEDEIYDVKEDAGDFNFNGLDYEESVKETESERDDNDSNNIFDQKKSKRRSCKPEKEYTSDVNLDDSKDEDFDVDAEKATVKKCYVKKAKKLIINKGHEKELTKEILEAFEKRPILWSIKERSHDKAIRQIGFEAIAQEVNEKCQSQINWVDVRNRIKDIRDEYAREYDKKMNGEKCEMPWYTEHMKFLEENITCLINHKKKRNKRLKTLDESHMALYIQYYKNCEILWQINNIAFVVKSKKEEALKMIVEDIKTKHNIELKLYDMQRSLDYINRIYSTDKERQLKCEEDKTKFVPSSKFYAELSFLSESQGPFKCPYCNEIIHKFETYHQHVGRHTNSDPFKCALCEMRFNKLNKYMLHAKRHLGINNYNCDFCGKGYPLKAELDWHVREHTGEEPYLCDICGASFRSRHVYNNHKRRHEKRFRFECHICKHGFNYQQTLKDHVRVHLNIRDILCNICGKGFIAKKDLIRHQNIHSDTKRYKCNVCGKAFAQDTGLRAHRKQH